MKLLAKMNTTSLRGYCRKYRVPYRKILAEIRRADPDVPADGKARWAQGGTKFQVDVDQAHDGAVTWVGVTGMNI